MVRLLLGVATLVLISISWARVAVADSTKAGNTQPQYVFVVRDISPAASHHIVERAIISHYSDPKLALSENAISLDRHDKITRFPETMTLVGGVINLERAPVVHLIDGKHSRDLHTWSPTVKEAFGENDVPEIGQDDRVTPGQDSAVVHDMTVTIVRVNKTTVIEKEKIASVTIEKDDPTLLRGKTSVKTVGHDGVRERTYEVTREDGEQKSKVLKKTEITLAKEDRVVVKGTKLLIGRTMKGSASWYKSSHQAASNVFKRGTNVRVTNQSNGKSFEVTIDDFMAGTDKVIDLNPALFTGLGASLSQGIQTVLVEEVLN